MKNEKYYTPNIEDVRVGYEYEFQGLPKGWHKMIFLENDNLKTFKYNLKLEDCIRCSYLTKEQIEAEGWKLWEYKSMLPDLYYKKHGYAVRFCLNNIIVISEIMVGRGMEDCWNKTLYEGNCKSINEFRWICKLLKIKEEKL